jgi:hypothetical protein
MGGVVRLRIADVAPVAGAGVVREVVGGHAVPAEQQAREIINWCIQVVQNGKGYALDSKEMIAMEAYATYMNRGAKLDPGLNAQTAPFVISGPGYPTNDEGNR